MKIRCPAGKSNKQPFDRQNQITFLLVVLKSDLSTRRRFEMRVPPNIQSGYVAIILINAIAAGYLLLSGYKSFSDNIAFCFQVAVGAVFVSFAAFIAQIALRRVKVYLMVVGLILSSAYLITTFAAIYRGFGIHDGENTILPTMSTSLYFSVVTWTTLGYGDFKPAEGIELIAALEALTGYIFLGLIVGITSGLAMRR